MNSTNRLEYKYKISYREYLQLKPLLASLLEHDRHGEDESYPITSVYLDDIYFNGAMDKAFGNQYHKKYRLRYYHDPTKIKLELKEKVGHETTKHATSIDTTTYQAIVNQELDALDPLFDDPLIRRFALDMRRFHFQPSSTILYHREAYKDSSGNLRVTFDHNLQASRDLPQDTLEYIHLMHGSDLILEVKYEHYLPKEIKTILHKHKLHQISVSKYFLGYAQITP